MKNILRHLCLLRHPIRLCRLVAALTLASALLPSGHGATTTILSEGFEGAFPGAWEVGDANPDGDPAWWDDVDRLFGSILPYSGNWSAYCAGIGWDNFPWAPRYEDSMEAYMARTIDLRNVGSGTLRFYYNLPSIESCCDALRVYVDGHLVWSVNMPSGGWRQATVNLDAYAGRQPRLSFEFHSDSSIVGEGAYLDEILVTGTDTGTPDIRVAPLALTVNLTNATASAPAEAPAAAPAAEESVPPAPDRLVNADEVLRGFLEGRETVRVIVNLTAPPGTPHGHEWQDAPTRRGWQQRVHALQEEAIATLARHEFKLRRRFENQAGFSAEVSWSALHKLMNHPRVLSIEPVRLVEPHLAQGIPLMNAAATRSAYDGAGLAIAIVDTGVDYTHLRLGGGGFPNSKVIGGYDFGDDDADPRPHSSQPHGTACAGIAAGDLGTTGDYIGGVAPAAKIYALKITAGNGGQASTDDMAAAWDWCVTHRNDDPAHPLLVVSTSFGAGRYLASCDEQHSAMTRAANNAAAAGITVLASSGNDGYCDAMGWPACISSVISVGAVYDAAFGTNYCCLKAESCAPKLATSLCGPDYTHFTADITQPDRITSYCNMASFLDLLAPGNATYTTDIVGAGGYTSGDYVPAFGGTSAACPYAAGAVAALQSAARSILGRHLTPAEVRAKLTSTGDNIADTKVAIAKPRVNLGRAIASLAPPSSATFTLYNDGTAPLTVSAIMSDTAAAWLAITPGTPFTIPSGGSLVATVTVDRAAVPAGTSTRRLLITSNDPDESPYPGGVTLTVNKPDSRPVLRLIRSGNRMVLSWPASANGFLLESADALRSPAVWAPVAGTPVTVGSEKFMTNVMTGAVRFYRLRQ